jgi:hypothetical protein
MSHQLVYNKFTFFEYQCFDEELGLILDAFGTFVVEFEDFELQLVQFYYDSFLSWNFVNGYLLVSANDFYNMNCGNVFILVWVNLW